MRKKLHAHASVTAIATVADYPRYYKNTSRHTAVLSKNQFIEVKTLRSVTVISRGENIHIVEDARLHDKPSDKETFDLAMAEGLRRINETY